jgi:hypothetical protein
MTRRRDPNGGESVTCESVRVSDVGYLWPRLVAPLGPHRPFFDWENGRAMDRAVPLGDEDAARGSEDSPQ